MRPTHPCLFPNCSGPASSTRKQYCPGHLAQLRAGKELTQLRPYAKATQQECLVEQCERPCPGQYCSNHQGIAWRMGVHPSELSALYATGCLICGTEANLTIDHDHACCPGYPACGACVRGALCQACNTRAGYFEKDPTLVARTLNYVHTQTRIIGLRKSEARRYKQGPPKPPRKTKPKDIVRLDIKKRVSVGRFLEQGVEYRIEALGDGRISIRPAVTIPQSGGI